MAEDTTKICSLKLFVDKKSLKVLFAEAPKEFVDVLFDLLSLPIGSIIDVIGKDVLVGSRFNRMYESVKDLCTTFLLPNYQNNDQKSILWPKPSLGQVEKYVKGTVMYMVLDDLTVKPMNTMSIVDVIVNKLKIKDAGSIEELIVDVSLVEVLKIVLASMKSMTVLTDVFFNKEEEEDFPFSMYPCYCGYCEY